MVVLQVDAMVVRLRLHVLLGCDSNSLLVCSSYFVVNCGASFSVEEIHGR